MTATHVGSGSVVQTANGLKMVKVAPGDFYVSEEPVQIVTVLGSCVSACVRDSLLNIGGMNHFMLPKGDYERASSWGGDASAVNRFGNFAMENLIKSIVSLGGSRDRLEVKLFGGGRVLDMSADVGATNVQFVLSYLQTRGLEVASMDVGRDYARKLLYEPHTGRARMKKLRGVYDGYVVSAEKKLMTSMPTSMPGTAQEAV